jgi:hypothetical protein
MSIVLAASLPKSQSHLILPYYRTARGFAHFFILHRSSFDRKDRTSSLRRCFGGVLDRIPRFPPIATHPQSASLHRQTRRALRSAITLIAVCIQVEKRTCMQTSDRGCPITHHVSWLRGEIPSRHDPGSAHLPVITSNRPDGFLSSQITPPGHYCTARPRIAAVARYIPLPPRRCAGNNSHHIPGQFRSSLVRAPSATASTSSCRYLITIIPWPDQYWSLHPSAHASLFRPPNAADSPIHRNI